MSAKKGLSFTVEQAKAPLWTGTLGFSIPFFRVSVVGEGGLGMCKNLLEMTKNSLEKNTLAEMSIIDLPESCSLNRPEIQAPVWAGCVWFLGIRLVCAFLWLMTAIVNNCYVKNQFNFSQSQPFWTGCFDSLFKECPVLPYYNGKHNWEQIFHKTKHTPTE